MINLPHQASSYTQLRNIPDDHWYVEVYVGRLSSGIYYSFRDYFAIKVVDILNTYT